jgi:signal transduction histidine kinase
MSSFAIERLSEVLFRDATPRRRLAVFGLAVACTAAIGIIDFSIGYHISLLAFYFFPLSMAVMALGWRAGLAISVLAVSGWLIGDYAVGRYRTSTTFVAVWNASIVFITFLSIAGLLAALLAAYRKMDEKVKLRTEALQREVEERARLETEILEISERERRKVGHDLHDGLGQHLTGTAFAGQVVHEKLASKGVPEAADVEKVVRLIQDAIAQTRRLARGLLLTDIEKEGLAIALQEMCLGFTEQFRIPCEFVYETPLAVTDKTAAAHLFRIANEAVWNALRHGRAKKVMVELVHDNGVAVLQICDDGIGVPPLSQRRRGMGIDIMQHRATTIGAELTIQSREAGGTVVRCRLGLPNPT